jgi:hypothetical protein
MQSFFVLELNKKKDSRKKFKTKKQKDKLIAAFKKIFLLFQKRMFQDTFIEE